MRFILLILMILILPSCFEQTDCLINNTNILKITLKGKTLGKDTTVTFISIYVLKDENVLYTNQALGTLEVPLETTDSAETVVFNYMEMTKSVSDTLVITYRNELRVISPDCGAFLYQHDINVPHTTFEKTRVITSVLLTTDKKNLEIFL